MFKKTFFIAALAIVGASASVNAATLGEANSAIGAISGCSGAACDSSIQAAIAAVQSLRLAHSVIPRQAISLLPLPTHLPAMPACPRRWRPMPPTRAI